MTTPESIKRTIEDGLACEQVEVVGDGQHFEALIVSDAFEGLAKCSATSASTPRWATACARKSTRCR